VTVLSRMVEPFVAVETPPVDAAAVLAAVAEAELFLFGKQSIGRVKWKGGKERNRELESTVPAL
jgi:hypothetical protein